MQSHVFAAVLLAAVLHGSWNLLVKINIDRFAAVFFIHVLMGLAGAVMLTFTGLPAAASLSFAVTSGILHTAYNVLLARSYAVGEMSVVYPVARGAAPAISLVLSLVLAGDRMSGAELAGLGLLITGLWLVALGRGGRFTAGRQAMIYALATAFFIGIYTVVDGMGARISGQALAYSGAIFLLDGLFMLVLGLALRGPQIVAQVRPFLWRGLTGALFSTLAYGLIIWAMSVEKIGSVAALRETSILFVLIMSRLALKETLTPLRIGGGLFIVAGAAFLRFG